MKMRDPLVFLLLTISLFACNPTEQEDVGEAVFTSELHALQEYFSIPGLSATVMKGEKVIYENYLGFADLERQLKLTSSTAFPIASITKLYSATLVMKLVEEGDLSLEDPVNQLLPEMAINDSIKVKHLLSHTSQGEIGEQFFYSSRFAWLTQVIEKSSGQSFESLLQEEIIAPLGLEHTYLLKDALQLGQRQEIIASPYVLQAKIERGFLDFGYTASAGIVATSGDLLVFNQALDDGTLLTETSKHTLYNGLNKDLPYSYGLFKQEIKGVEALWSYGQYDCYSSLLIKIPAQNLTLVLLANNNLLSDPARLLMGDLTTSLFAMSFLKNFVFNFSDMPLFEQAQQLDTAHLNMAFYRQKVLAQAQAESFMARYVPAKITECSALLEKVFTHQPEYLSYADINLLHTLSFMKDVAYYMNLGAFNTFDQEIEAIGTHLLEKEPNNPYLHVYLGGFYDKSGDKAKARYHYETIVDLENFSSSWYTEEAETWLKVNNDK